MSPAVAVHHLVKAYRKESRAVDDISFEIEPGQVFGLLGPNGAGKTTTIKMILGLVLPTSGEISLAGYDVETQRGQALRHAGAVLEGSRNIYWRLSARANLEYFGGLHGKALRQRIDALLDLLELADHAAEETRNFSRGMQQKVALAVALLHEPDVLLLDEPTLGLDVQSARTIEGVIREMAANGKAVLLTTHQMALAEKLAERIFVIHKGKQVAEGGTAALLGILRPVPMIAMLVFLVALVGAAGLGFAFAGLGLVYRRIDTLMGQLWQALLFFSGALAPIHQPLWAAVARCLPLSWGIECLRAIFLEGATLVSLWQSGLLAGLLLNTACYLLLGWGLFSWGQRRARALGTLAQY